MPFSELKRRRLRALSTPSGIIAALAMDQRKSLRRMIADAAGKPLDGVSDGELAAFKSTVAEVLSGEASAILLDPEYGLEAAGRRPGECGLLLTYESDGYENPRPHRMLALMPGFSVRRLRELGADAIKILLSYTPFDDARCNDEKLALIERIGSECRAMEMPFFLEPVGYDPGGKPPASPEYARLRPEIVLRSMEEFSKERYGVDVLKVEFPVDAAYVEGSAVYAGDAIWPYRDALEVFRRVDSVTPLPYIYLSAGVSRTQFTESLRLAAEAGARFSGVLCGRATWQDGVAEYARGGTAALRDWLSNGGCRNIAAINECLSAAIPWCARPAATAA